jgi:hypothetical protein
MHKIEVSRVAPVVLALGLMACGARPPAAQAQGQSADLVCTGALATLMSEWQSIGFAEPSKPAQMIVAGRNGYTVSGGQFNYLRTQIRMASRDCENGRDNEALSHLVAVYRVLDRLRHS